ncbi:hypothetical protein QE152_g188 [Popillia japonica]|uniref:Uncharacterized protein n=1 Tax=Popillia japonica TaxID=7064 RepID=A0AAW1NFC2_POPJA
MGSDGRVRMNRDFVLWAQMDVLECGDDKARDMVNRVLPSEFHLVEVQLFHLVEVQLWLGEAYLLTDGVSLYREWGIECALIPDTGSRRPCYTVYGCFGDDATFMHDNARAH